MGFNCYVFTYLNAVNPLTTLTSRAGNSTCPPILNVTAFQPSTLMCTCVSNFWTSLGLFDTWDKRKNHEKHLVIDFSKDILSEKFFQKAQFMEIIEPD